MSRRSGATLIEVLVAIFVTALGLLGLLALFPLGAVSMARAIKDSRCAQAAANASALAEAMNIRSDPLVLGSGDAFVDQIKDPHGNLIPPSPDGPSYPVYVDPFGFYEAPSAGRLPIAGPWGAVGPESAPPPPYVPQSGIPRRNVSFVFSSPTPLPTALRSFALLDDVTFGQDGHSSSAVQRDGRYSWAYLLRRPRAADRSIVDLTVVVYSGRSLRFSNNGPGVADLGERAYGPVAFDPNSNVVSVFWDASKGEEKPAIRSGSWILDATTVKEVPPKSGKFQAEPHGFFYRVVNVTEKANQLDLELQTKPRLSTINTTGALPVPYGVVVVLDGVAEVFEKGPGWRP